MSNRRPNAFTLIELLIAVAIAMAMVAVAISAMRQIRITTERTVVRLALHQRAGLLADQLSQRFMAMQQHGALVVEWHDDGTPGAADPRLRLLFLRGVFDQNDWNYSAYGDYPSWPSPTSTDLVWDLWEWRASNHALYAANSQLTARSIRGRKADGSNLVINGVSYGNQYFLSLPQPRRTLPAAWKGALNDNLLFPATPGDLEHSASLIAGDAGDWTWLREHLVPMLQGTDSATQDPADPTTWDGVSEFALQLRLRNGAIEEFTPASPQRTLIIPGVRIDGRPSASEGAGAQDLADAVAAAAGRRPDLLRLRFTLRDRRTGIAVPFSFSFPLPGFATTP